jgi:membrane protease YdiL (CAAX protease family)
MLVQTIASAIARLVGREGSADLGFRRGHEVGRHLVFAVLFPFVIGAVAYGAAWATGHVGLRVLPLGMWAVLFFAMLALNVVVSTGEELGWRGYMLDRMAEVGVPRPILVRSLSGARSTRRCISGAGSCTTALRLWSERASS